MRVRRIENVCVALVGFVVCELGITEHALAQEKDRLPPVTVETPANRVANKRSRVAKPERIRRLRQANRRQPAEDPAIAAQAAAKEAYRTREGSEARGYKPDTATNFGPWGQKPILDIPFSVNVISSDIIENLIGSTTDDIYKISPVTQLVQPQNRLLEQQANLRGFTNTSVAIDGLRTGTGNGQFLTLEDKERVEIYTGLTGFLFGPTDVGGLINYVYKKPTPVPYASVTVGDLGNLAGVAHLDVGGPIDKEGKFAYRINIAGQDGPIAFPGQNEQRDLITGVFDWNVTPDTKIEVLGSHQDAILQGVGVFWNPGGGFNYKFVPDIHQYWGQPWTSTHAATDRAEVNINSKLNDFLTFRAAYSIDREQGSQTPLVNNTWTNNNGGYSQAQSLFAGRSDLTQSTYEFVDATFATGSVEHKVTTGFFGNFTTFRSGAGIGTLFTSSFNVFAGPTYVPEPVFGPNPASIGFYNELVPLNYTQQTNYIIGDDVKFNQYWSALIGVNYSSISQNSFNIVAPPFPLTSAVDQSKASPSLALTFKPLSWMSTYVSYNQSLQRGLMAPNLATVTNAGVILPAFVSDQYEVGAKADLGGVLLTGALFNINKANQFAQVNPNGTQTYVSDGREVHKGIEITATGNIMAGLRLLGGVTIMDARTIHTASVTTDDKMPVNVADQYAKATVEYDLPFLSGLTVTGGVYYTGKQAVDTINTIFLPSYVTEDIGIRYRRLLANAQELIFRLNVSNVTDRAYWVNSSYTGQPRTVAFNMQYKF